MKKFGSAISLILIMVIISACAGKAPEEKDDHLGDGSVLETEVVDGELMAPDGEAVEFIGVMESDETGNIRLARTASSIPTGDYAFAYYQTYFGGDNEVHAIINTNLKTTTSIRFKEGVLLIDTFELTEGEDEDASLLFIGILQGSYGRHSETGDIPDMGRRDESSCDPTGNRW